MTEQIKKQVKKIEETVHGCTDCSYCMYFSSGRIWACGHDDGQGEISRKDEPIGFPDWCPLENGEDPGVKVGLTALIIRNGKVLLGLRHNTETADGLWAFPGGRMDYGEDPESGLVREVFEETGIKINPFKMNFLTHKNEFFPEEKKHYLSHVYLITDSEEEPELKEPDKCKTWKWFDPFELPENTFWPCLETLREFKDLIENSIVEQEKKEILDLIKET
jgi:8-oxo-dGTP diphosphatase